MLAYAAELRLTQVRVNLLDPGPMATRLRAHGLSRRAPGHGAAEPALPRRRWSSCCCPNARVNGELVRWAQSVA